MTFAEQQYQVYLSAKLKDRGNIKWSMAMMMPEHVQLLQRAKEQDVYIKRPQLTEWELEDMQQSLMMALSYKLELEYKLWNNGRYEYHHGIIARIDEHSREFYYSDTFMKIHGPYNLDNVVSIAPLD